MKKIKSIAKTLMELSVKDVNDLLNILNIKYNMRINDNNYIKLSSKKQKKKKNKQTTFDLILTSFGNSKLAIVKLVKEITNKCLTDSKRIVDNVPSILKKKITKKESENIKKQFEDLGAEVELK